MDNRTRSHLDDPTIEELIKHYHRNMYSDNDIRGFFLLRHNVYISGSKIKRIKRKLGLKRNSIEATYAEIVPAIQAILLSGYTDWGYKSIWRLLNVSFRIRATQETVRRVLKLLDPLGVELRSRNRLRRRIYQNQGPGYMIHMDGYDKLKPFGFSIHGCLDGYSRKILWLKLLRSNKNPYVVSKCYFDYLNWCKRLPKIIRCDAGTENVVTCDVHAALRNSTDGGSNTCNVSVIVGSSTSNQRIEMFWGILKKGFTQHWRNIFQDMQDCGLLNTSSADDIEILRLWFAPVLQNHLNIFAEHWNNHRIRSQRDSERLSGAVPDVLYYQPERFGNTDCSVNLPFNDDDMQHISSHFSISEPRYICTDEFFDRFLRTSGLDEENLELPTVKEDAVELFSLTKQILT